MLAMNGIIGVDSPVTWKRRADYTLDLKFNGKCDSDTACQDDPCLEGVVMQWSSQNDTANYIIISHYAKSACIARCTLPGNIVDKLCSGDSWTTDTPFLGPDEGIGAVYVITDIGELFLVRISSTGSSVAKLANTNKPVVWVGELQEDSMTYVCFVHKNGDGMVLDVTSIANIQDIIWTPFFLQKLVICCCAVKSHLITSDGSCLRIVHVVVIQNTLPNCGAATCSQCKKVMLKVLSLSLPEVIAVESTDDVITLRTSDMKKFQSPWNELHKAATEENTSDEVISESAAALYSVENIMEQFKKYSKLNAQHEKECSDMKMYIEQLNIALNLHRSSCENTKAEISDQLWGMFKLQYDVQPCLHGECVFILRVRLDYSGVLQLDRRWWRLQVSVPTSVGTKHVVFNQPVKSLNTEETKTSFDVAIRRDDAKHLLTLQDLYLTCEVFLIDYQLMQHIFGVQVVKEKVNIFKFLAEEKMVRSSSQYVSFYETLIQQNKNAYFNDHAQFPDSNEIKLVFPYNSRFSSLLLESLCLYDTTSPNKRSVLDYFPVNVKRWYCDDVVSCHASVAKLCMSVVLTGSCVPLLVAIKRQLTLMYTTTTSDTGKNLPATDTVAVPISVKSECSLVNLMLNDIASDATSLHLQTMYERLNQIVNSLP